MSERISPTAHYTGRVWLRNGLSDPGLATREGQLMYAAAQPLMRAADALGLPTLEPYLLARHREIDARLTAAIDAGQVSRVVEVAAGLSGRGLRFARRYETTVGGPPLVYVEADLAGMAARKRSRLAAIGTSPSHTVRTVDALQGGGRGSLEALFAELDPGRGTCVITEGLLAYLPRDGVLALWNRLARGLDRFSAGVYLADIHLEIDNDVIVTLFAGVLGAFVGGRVSAHFSGVADVRDALLDAGFAAAEVASPHRLAHVLEARTVLS